MRQAFDRGFYVGGALASMMTVTKGKMPNGRFPTHPNDEADPQARRGAPKPDGKYVFDKLSSVFASGNRTRDDQPSHLQVAHRVGAWRRRGRGCARRTCTRWAATSETAWSRSR